MKPDHLSVLQTKRAMFMAAVAAEAADERYVSTHRIVASLLRTDAFREFCSRHEIDSAPLMAAADETQSLSFEICEGMAKKSLAERNVEFLSEQHQAALQLRPIDPTLGAVIGDVIARRGALAISPLALLLEVIRRHPALEARLASHGLTVHAIRADIEGKENP